ncbi:hypothetical protein BGW38_008970 [Lunasporangiospora selenospora]|uniref:NlpC/P60 domain-containing protein n=1 Tax=Lunasporangiospora selenospora TaxID=979761 RepID=A0A9P6FY33_9FUNG|nr:hypothetical protein BGW38_008970 [Lunasporangiospora selenospora]
MPVDVNKTIAAARSQKGIPYSWGGGHGAKPGKSLGTCQWYSGPKPCKADKTVGFDCSGLVRYAVYLGTGKKIDIGKGGNTTSQYNDARVQHISAASRRAGDIVFFGTTSNIYHVALYIGKINGKEMMIEAQKTGVPVHEVPLRLSNGLWARVK